MMKPIYIFLILILATYESKATTQIPDVLFFGKDTLYFYDSPLEKIEDVTRRISELREGEYNASTACMRGFRAEWKITDDILYLVNVFDCHTEKNLNPIIEEILGIKFKNGLIKASFIDGEVCAGKDKINEQSFYIPIYKEILKFNFKGGIVINMEKL